MCGAEEVSQAKRAIAESYVEGRRDTYPTSIDHRLRVHLLNTSSQMIVHDHCSPLRKRGVGLPLRACPPTESHVKQLSIFDPRELLELGGGMFARAGGRLRAGEISSDAASADAERGRETDLSDCGSWLHDRRLEFLASHSEQVDRVTGRKEADAGENFCSPFGQRSFGEAGGEVQEPCGEM